MIAQVAFAASALATVAILSRLLTKGDYGLYAAIIAALAFTNAFVGTALGTDVLAASVEKNATVTIRSRDALTAVLLVAAGIVPITAYLGGWDVVPVALCCGGALLVAEVAQGVILGRGEQRRYLRAALTRSAVAVLLLAAVILLPASLRLSGAVGVLGLSALAFAAFGIGHVRIGRGSTHAPSRAVSAIGVANLGLWLLATSDRVILGVRAGGAEVAVYAAIYGLIDRVLRSLINGHVAEWLPEAFALQRTQRRVTNLSRLWSYATLLTVSVIALALGAGPVVSLLTGGRFSADMSQTALLAVGIGLLGLASPLYVVLVSDGRAHIAAWAAIAAAAVNISGNWVLDPLWGATAASALTAAGYATFVAITAVWYLLMSRPAIRLEKPVEIATRSKKGSAAA